MVDVKILSLGTPFEGDSYTVSGFGNAPTLSDFNAVIVDMAHIGEFFYGILHNENLRDHSGIPWVHQTTVYLWVEQGRLPHVNLSAGSERRCLRFDAEEIRQWVEDHHKSGRLDGRRLG